MLNILDIKKKLKLGTNLNIDDFLSEIDLKSILCYDRSKSIKKNETAFFHYFFISRCIPGNDLKK